jgi:hypothetical protein
MNGDKTLNIARGKSLIHLEKEKHTSIYLHEVTEITREHTQFFKNDETHKSFYHNVIKIKHADGSEPEREETDKDGNNYLKSEWESQK